MNKKNFFTSSFILTLAITVLIIAAGAEAKISLDNLEIINQFTMDKLSSIKDDFAQDHIVVKYKDDNQPFRVINVPKGRIGDKIKEYLSKSNVEYAEPDYTAYALMTPNDTYYKYQWNLRTAAEGGINVSNAWDITTGKSSIIVAVIDTGIAYENYGKYCKASDLMSTQFAPGYNFITNNMHANDDNGHGTHVSGTIAQTTNNTAGVAGIAFKTTLMPIKVLNSSGSGSYSNIAKGIRYAADHGAKVINLSIGGSSASTILEQALKYAYDKGVAIVAACGNDNINKCSYPAAYTNYVISVGATQYNKTKAPYSNYGTTLDIVAPGGNTSVDQNSDALKDGIIQQTFPGSAKLCSFGYYLYQGTSMATPHVAGTAALLLAKGNATNPSQIKTAIQSTAKDLGTPGKDSTYGYGLLDAYAALKWIGAPVNPANNNCSSDSACNDGIYCNGTEKCSSGTCVSGTAITCDDGNSCTSNTCNESTKACAYNKITDNSSCSSGVCCAGVCKTGSTSCSAGSSICWNGSNKYLLLSSTQFKKFCKCAQGTYLYRTFKYSIGSNIVWKYSSTSDDAAWATAQTTSSTPVSSVTCSNGIAYPTNQSYSYPK